ncbi:MAG TPA: nodulation protein NfeD, partial [Pseudolabrys sp.]|nr:nodulation protein NfeD [Pseudolabrys sp.]
MAKLFSGFLAAAVLMLLPCATSAQDASGAGIAVVLDVSGGIGPATAEYVHNGLAQAETRHASVIVLRLDTPGGLST